MKKLIRVLVVLTLLFGTAGAYTALSGVGVSSAMAEGGE